jgi:hypothetical protein
MILECKDGNFAVISVGGNAGTFIGPAADANPTVAAHEAGHLMGLADYYSTGIDPRTGDEASLPSRRKT